MIDCCGVRARQFVVTQFLDTGGSLGFRRIKPSVGNPLAGPARLLHVSDVT
jgi:hypothetical protein